MKGNEVNREISVIGLGLSNRDWSDGTRQVLSASKKLILQTEHSRAAEDLTAASIAFETLDDLYERAEDFDIFSDACAERIVQCAEEGAVCFAVPGSPEGLPILVALRRRAALLEIPVRVIPALGYGENALAPHMGERGFEEPAVRCFASSLLELDWKRPLAVQEIDTPLLASEVKLELLDLYPPDLLVFFSQCQDGETLEKRIPLQDLDRLEQEDYDHTSCLLVPSLRFEELTRFGMGELYQILQRLRGPGGCPWDAEQTHASLRGGLLEEAYEVADAIDKEDDDALCEELGDLLLQVCFHTLIAQEQGAFSYRDVSSGVSQKMISRHPHVFAGEVVADSAEVLDRWEDLKRKEKQQETVSDTLFAVPKAFPSLMRAAKLQKRAAKVGFDWDDVEGALEKTEEERKEWLAEWAQKKQNAGKAEDLEMEMGDWLFSLVNVARLAQIDPETALERSSEKFLQRFAKMEQKMISAGVSLEKADLNEMNEYWEMAKHIQ